MKRFNKYLKYSGVEGTTDQKVKMEYGGINHFAWLTKLEHNGKDLLQIIHQNANYAYQSKKFHRPFNFYLMEKYGYYSYVEDRHVAEFLPKYYNFFNYKDNPFGIKLRDVRNIHKQRRWAYSTIRWGSKRRNHWFLRLFTRPMEGGEKALILFKNKLNNIPKHHVCNIRNNNTIPNLPEECIIEAPCYFKDDKLYTSKVGPLPKPIDEWVRIHAKNQKSVVEAALNGDTDKLLEALLADPMCQFIEDDEKIEYMMKNMLYYQRKWLPNFSESIPTLKELKNFKYSIDWKEISSFESARKEKFKPDNSLKTKAWPQVE